MKKFNIRKVLDGLKEVSSSTPSVQVGPQENHLIQETLQSEHFQLCKCLYILLIPHHISPSHTYTHTSHSYHPLSSSHIHCFASRSLIHWGLMAPEVGKEKTSV
ncbi:hypothetical protein PAMP_014136 [Pampus punctatissimus]